MHETAKCVGANGMPCHPHLLEQKHKPKQQMGYRVLSASNCGGTTHTPQTANGHTPTDNLTLGSAGDDDKVHSRGTTP